MDSDGLSTAYAGDADLYGLDMEHPNIFSSRDVGNYLVDLSSSSSVASEIEHDFDDSDETDSDTDVDSSSDSEAQYITIPHQSPWWKPPKSSDSVSFDTLVDDDLEDDDAPSSHSLHDVLQEQQFLVAVFHDELRRIIPGEFSYRCDDEWLNEVDAKLLLAPVEAFEETCMSSMASSSRPSSTDFGAKPVPDVPVDFEELIDAEGSIEEWEWVITVAF